MPSSLMNGSLLVGVGGQFEDGTEFLKLAMFEHSAGEQQQQQQQQQQQTLSAPAEGNTLSQHAFFHAVAQTPQQQAASPDFSQHSDFELASRPVPLPDQDFDSVARAFGRAFLAPPLPQPELDHFASTGYQGGIISLAQPHHQRYGSAAPAYAWTIGPNPSAAAGYVPDPTYSGTEANQFPAGGQFGTVIESAIDPSLAQVAEVDAVDKGVDERGVQMRNVDEAQGERVIPQMQMGNPDEAERQRIPPQIQAQARSRRFTRQTRGPAGQQGVVEGANIVMQPRRAARGIKPLEKYNADDKRVQAKLQNKGRKAEIAAISASEDAQWASLVEDATLVFCGPSRELDEIVAASYRPLVYVPRIQPDAEEKNANARAKWKSEDGKRQRRFECWQLARWWARHAQLDLPTYGKKTSGLLGEDWARALEALPEEQQRRYRDDGPEAVA